MIQEKSSKNNYAEKKTMDITQIQKRIEAVEDLQREIRDAKQMLKEELESDDRYSEILDQANEINSKKKRVKEEIENSGSNKKLLQEIKDNKEELDTLREILSAELIQIYSEQKVDVITDSSGELRKFKISVKLSGRGNRYEDRDSFGKFEKDN